MIDIDLARRKFFLTLKVEQNASPATIRAYGIDLREFSRFLSEKKSTISDCDRTFIRSYLGHIRQRPLSRATVLRKWAALRSFFKFLTREDIVPANPCVNLPTPKRERRIPSFLTEKEVDQLIENMSVARH